jgi:hypothetical protein
MQTMPALEPSRGYGRSGCLAAFLGLSSSDCGNRLLARAILADAACAALGNVRHHGVRSIGASVSLLITRISNLCRRYPKVNEIVKSLNRRVGLSTGMYIAGSANESESILGAGYRDSVDEGTSSGVCSDDLTGGEDDLPVSEIMRRIGLGVGGPVEVEAPRRRLRVNFSA